MTWEPPRSVSPGSAMLSAFALESSPLIAARADRATQSSRRLRFFMTKYYAETTLFGTPPPRMALFSRVAADLDNAVLRGVLAGVAELMRSVLGDVENVAGPGLFGFSIVLEDDRALNDDDHFGVLDGVSRVRRGSGRLLGFVYVDDLAGREGASENIAALASVGHLARRNLIERVDTRLCEHAWCCCGLVLRYAGYRCQSRQTCTHLTPRHLLHAALLWEDLEWADAPTARTVPSWRGRSIPAPAPVLCPGGTVPASLRSCVGRFCRRSRRACRGQDRAPG